jgi:hypothetical protein
MTMRALTPLGEYDYFTYDTLIDSFEVEVLARKDDDDYQGDTRLLVRDGERYGLIVFGWGSCSGCDALEAAGGNLADLTELRDAIWNGAHWEPSAADMVAYIDRKDWSLDYSHDPAFLAQARVLLGADVSP